MALNIKSDEADRLARELVAETGESLTDAVTVALRDRLERCRAGRDRSAELARDAELDDIFRRARALVKHDPRTDDEILGYNEIGTFD